MSDDYAALVTTVDLAVLLIGTVQVYTLFQQLTGRMMDGLQEAIQGGGRALSAIREGRNPTAADLALARSIRRPYLVLTRSWHLYLVSSVWIVVCGVLVGVQVLVLKWSATHEPAKDPNLASFSFYVSASAVVLLAVEGIVRVIWSAAGRLRTILERVYELLRDVTPEEYQALTAPATPGPGQTQD